MSASRLSMKVLLSRCPPICARLGGLSAGACGSTGRRLAAPASGLPLTPITSTRRAPRCSAGLIGAVWRTAPSPKNSAPTRTGGNSSGIAELASRCAWVNSVGAPRRRWRRQGAMASAAW
ncbi:hypothetical protein D3C81_1992550 [compost metagenome]